MSKIKLNVESPLTGLHVDFVAPCSSEGVEGLLINNEVYSVVNVMGVPMTGIGGAWVKDAIVSVILDTEHKKAYLANRGVLSVSKTFTLTANGWSSTAPYTQKISIPGILATDDPFADVYLDEVDDGSDILDAWYRVGRMATENDSITAYCYEEKPTVNIPIIVKVVR